MNIDKFWLGAVIGVVIPVISFFVFMALVFKTHSHYTETLQVLNGANMAIKALTACVVPSFFIFFLFYWKRYNKAAQGVVFSALILTFSLVIYSEFIA